MSMQNVSDQ